jgi:hypothetical protein
MSTRLTRGSRRRANIRTDQSWPKFGRKFRESEPFFLDEKAKGDCNIAGRRCEAFP